RNPARADLRSRCLEGRTVSSPRFTRYSGRPERLAHHPRSNEGDFMARIIVTTDPRTDHAAPVLLEESVYSMHLDNEHNAAQLIDPLAWAISDTENTHRME